MDKPDAYFCIGEMPAGFGEPMVDIINGWPVLLSSWKKASMNECSLYGICFEWMSEPDAKAAGEPCIQADRRWDCG